MNEPSITLIELQEIISNTLSDGLERYYWLTAEISEININYSGHCYLELVEKKSKDSAISARLRAVIWSSKARFLLPYFKTSAGTDMKEGISVLVKGKIEYHPVYGLSLLIEDIDPAYTIGDLAMKRQEIIEKLRSEGIIEMNKELDLPLHPGRIAVISSGEAAGYGDLKDQLINNPYSYIYEIDLFSAVMQGKETEKSVVAALSEIGQNYASYDLVVIVRGGGSQADLSWFDSYEIAYLITQFPLPVISGIGHDKDVSVTDIVANTSCKTPTAVANMIIDLSLETDRYLNSLGHKIITSAREYLIETEASLSTRANKLSSMSRIILLSAKTRLKNREEQIRSATKFYIKDNFNKLSGLRYKFKTEPARMIKSNETKLVNIKRAIDHLSPEEVLKRGYSITLRKGKSLKNTDDLKNADSVTTILHSGKFDSEVFDIRE